MIQRIQTLYLLLAAIVVALPLFVPIAGILEPNGPNYTILAYGLVEAGMESTHIVIVFWAQFILFLAMIILPLITIFLYKKRFLQWRLCLVEIILLLGSMVMMWIYIRHFANTQGMDVIYHISFIFPLISAVLIWMAMRGIRNDIRLLKSYDRIR